MTKKEKTRNIIILASEVVLIVVCLICMMTQMISQTTGLILITVLIVSGYAIFALMNYKHSAYGGKFKSRYPDKRS